MCRRIGSITIVMLLSAGIASAALYIGNPNADNGWSTTSAVSVKASHGQWERNSIHLIDGSGLDAATGTMHNAGDNYPRELWDAAYNGSSAGTTESNPNPEGPVYSPCWLLFEFDQPYPLDEMWVWNLQLAQYTCGGLNNVTVQYSLTGGSSPSDWIYANAGATYVGDPVTDPGHFQWPEAPGTDDYLGFSAVSFGGALAKYVYVAVHDIAPTVPDGGDWDAPYGDVGLDEVRFSYIPEPTTLILMSLSGVFLARRRR